MCGQVYGHQRPSVEMVAKGVSKRQWVWIATGEWAVLDAEKDQRVCGDKVYGW